MQNSRYFYHFSFVPKKLIEERNKVEKQFKDIDKDIALHRSHTQLPKLLEKIRAAAPDKIDELAKSLTKMDIRLLIYEYPYPNEKNETRYKINRILDTRYTSIVGRTAWDLFQQDISDPFLQDLIGSSYFKEPETFLGINEELLGAFRTAMKKESDIIEGLVPYMLRTRLKTEQLLKEWKVKEGSVLEEALLKKMFRAGLHEDFIISRDGEMYIAKSLEKFSMDDYKMMLKVYIEARNYEEFHQTIMHDATKYRLDDPRENEGEWDFLTHDALLQVRRWVIQKNLIEVFASDPDNKRFNYWKRFIRYMEDVELANDPKVAFIYFKEFVVLEFGNIGSAYFYHKKGFEKFIYPIKNSYKFRNSKSTTTKEDMLKDRSYEKQGTKLFINKLDHRGQIWIQRFNEQMREYLNSVNE